MSSEDAALPSRAKSGAKRRSHLHVLLIEDINPLLTVCPQESLLAPGGSVLSACPKGPPDGPEAPEVTEHSSLFLSGSVLWAQHPEQKASVPKTLGGSPHPPAGKKRVTTATPAPVQAAGGRAAARSQVPKRSAAQPARLPTAPGGGEGSFSGA